MVKRYDLKGGVILSFKKYIRWFSTAISLFMLMLCMAAPAFAAESGNVWLEVPFDQLSSGQKVAITMDRDNITYAFSNKSIGTSVVVSPSGDSFIASSNFLTWKIYFNDDGTFRLLSTYSNKYLCSEAGKHPFVSVDDTAAKNWFIYNGFLTINLGSYYSLGVKSDGSLDDLKAGSSHISDCSSLRFWIFAGNSSFVDMVTSAFGTLIGWFGIMFSSLTVSNGALSPVLPFFMIAVSVPVILLCVKVVKKFTWGS